MKRDEIKAGALLSYLNLLIGNLIPFIYTPIMLRMLGQAEYGIYGIAQSVMGYIGLLNFGIGGSATLPNTAQREIWTENSASLACSSRYTQ